MGETCRGQGDEYRLAEALRHRFLGDGSPDPSVAVFKRMDGLEIQMGYARSGKGRQRFRSLRCRSIELCDELLHL